MEKVFIKWFEELKIEDVPSVGGKNASLGEMIQKLSEKGVAVPSGFAVTAYAYKYTIEKAGVDKKIMQILSDLNTHDVHNLAERGKKIRNIITLYFFLFVSYLLEPVFYMDKLNIEKKYPTRYNQVSSC